MRPSSAKRFLLPLILIAGLAGFFASGASQVISWQFLGQHYATIKSFSIDRLWLSYLIFFSAYSLAVAFSPPLASLFTLAGGAIFGWPAILLVVGAATTGAGLVFLAAQTLFSDLLRRRAGPFFNKLEAGFSENAFFICWRCALCQPYHSGRLILFPPLPACHCASFWLRHFLASFQGPRFIFRLDAVLIISLPPARHLILAF